MRRTEMIAGRTNCGKSEGGDALAGSPRDAGAVVNCCCARPAAYARLGLVGSNELLGKLGVSLREVGRKIEAVGWDGRYVTQEDPTGVMFEDVRSFWESWFSYVSLVMVEVERTRYFLETYRSAAESERLELVSTLRDYLFGTDRKRIELFFDKSPNADRCPYDDWVDRVAFALQDPLGQSPFGATIVARACSADSSFEELWREACKDSG